MKKEKNIADHSLWHEIEKRKRKLPQKITPPPLYYSKNILTGDISEWNELASLRYINYPTNKTIKELLNKQ